MATPRRVLAPALEKGEGGSEIKQFSNVFLYAATRRSNQSSRSHRHPEESRFLLWRRLPRLEARAERREARKITATRYKNNLTAVARATDGRLQQRQLTAKLHAGKHFE